MKNLSELKKDAKNYTWELYKFINPETEQNIPHKYLNVPRKIEKLQSNSLMFEGGSWLYFPKSKDISFEKYLYNDNDVIVTIKEDKFPIMSYHLRKII